MSRKGLFFLALGLGLGAGAVYLYKKGLLRPAIEVEIVEEVCPEACCCSETEAFTAEPECAAEAFGPLGETEACMHVHGMEQAQEVMDATAAEHCDDTAPDCPLTETAGDEVSDDPVRDDEAE